MLRYSSAPTALVANGFSFALGPKFERSKTKTVIGTQVDELDIKIYPETTDLIGDHAVASSRLAGPARRRVIAARTRLYADLRATPARER